MDFGASTSGFEARLCHLIFYLFGIECCYSTKLLATANIGSNIPSARRRGQRFHFLQCKGSSPSLRFVNSHEVTLRKAGWVAFTKTYSRGKRLISHLPPTFAIIIHSPRPLRPCIWRPRVPYLMSSSPSSRVPKSQVPTHASSCPRPTFIHSPSFLACGEVVSLTSSSNVQPFLTFTVLLSK